jgi:2-polyprenyl-6-hydroxyphenyl methylase/3-demethylubiquinone-9 3-methyltransferase
MASIDNRWYDRLGDSWWDEAGPVGALHHLNPARFAYFQNVLGDLSGRRVLDLGCGGGIFSETLARAGALVTGVDLSGASLRAAGRHARAGGLKIDYVNSDGLCLPFAGSSFDVVVTTDFLEHVTDPGRERLDRAAGETARPCRALVRNCARDSPR